MMSQEQMFQISVWHIDTRHWWMNYDVSVVVLSLMTDHKRLVLPPPHNLLIYNKLYLYVEQIYLFQLNSMVKPNQWNSEGILLIDFYGFYWCKIQLSKEKTYKWYHVVLYNRFNTWSVIHLYSKIGLQFVSGCYFDT